MCAVPKYLKLFLRCFTVEIIGLYRDLESLACNKLIVFHNRLLEACPFVILLQPVSVHDASFAEANVDRGALIAGWLSGYAHGNFQVRLRSIVIAVCKCCTVKNF